MKMSIAKIEAFASEDEQAPVSLKCAYLDCEGSRLVATDGHMAARVTVNLEDGDTSGLIPREAFDLARKELKALRKLLKDELPDPWLQINCGEDAIVIENLLSKTNHIVLRPKLGDSKYPDIDRVFPKEVGSATVTLSRELLSTLIAAMDGSGGLSFFVSGADDAVLVAPSTGEAAAILMPMRAAAEGASVLSRGVAVSVPAIAEMAAD